MSCRVPIAIAAISMACSGGPTPEAGPPATPAPPAAPAKRSRVCEQQPFAESTTLPEASGAAWLADGTLLVVSDSGNDGAYVILDPETGAERGHGKLPLGGGNDDLEGLAIRDGKLVGISSSGWIRVWAKDGAEYALVDGPYPIGPVDLPDKGRAKPGDPGMVCSERKTNCGRDYEGLCLVPAPAQGDRCVGFAASKTDGALYCLVDRDGKLAVDRGSAIEIAKRGAVADCAFSERGELFVGSNLFDTANVYRVTGWKDPAHATVDNLGPLGLGFPEVIAVRGDLIYRMSDTGGAPSLLTKYRCR